MTPDEKLETVVPNGFQIAQIFRNQRLLKTGAANKGAFAGSTLQGEQTLLAQEKSSVLFTTDIS